MDWPLAIDRNRKALSPIIAALFALVSAATAALTSPACGRGVAGAARDGEGLAGVFLLPRHVYAAILLILRPAESAVRRLILIAATTLATRNSGTVYSIPSAGRADWQRRLQELSKLSPTFLPRIPAFCLFDPLKRFGLDDYNNNALPSFSFESSYDPNFDARHFSQANKPVNAALLFARMRALRAALNDLPKQARRLARWHARRDLLLKSKRPFKPMRMSIFRPGLPPGWRQRSIHAVDDVLRECHGLAIYAVNGPDTG